MKFFTDLKFNRNMGCIEISVYETAFGRNDRFNRNMGCIEIAIGQTECNLHVV